MEHRPAACAPADLTPDERKQQTTRLPATQTKKSMFLRFLSPKIAVPTRTSVAPSSTATGKSFVIPMEGAVVSSEIQFQAGRAIPEGRQNIYGTLPPAPASGGIVIKPSIDKRGARGAPPYPDAIYQAEIRIWSPRPATLTSSRTRGCIPSSSAMRFMSLARATWSTL